MGSYLGRARPRPPSSALHGAAQSAASLPDRGTPTAPRLPSLGWALSVAHRLCREDRVAPPGRRLHRRRLVVIHTQRYAVEQVRCLFLGLFSAASSSHQKTPVLSVARARPSSASMILNLAPAKGKTLRLALERSVLTVWPSLTGQLSIPYAKETLIQPPEESLQGKVKEEKDLGTLRDSGEGLGEQEVGRAVSGLQQPQSSGSADRGNTQSAFRRLVVNGVLPSFMPRPGPLKREFCFKNSVNSLISKSQTFSLSSCSKRNAITSSYSSSRDFPLRPKRSSASGAGRPCPPSSRSQVPAEKASEEVPTSSSPASEVPQRKNKREKAQKVADADPLSGQQQNLSNCLSPSALWRPEKRKISLLLPCRRKDPLSLPPPPQLGYRVTVEDLDSEKAATIQWINKILKDDEAKTQSN